MAKRKHVVRRVVRKHKARRPPIRPVPSPAAPPASPPLNQVQLPPERLPCGPIRCFFMEETDRVQLSLRRYVAHDRGTCPLAHGYHNASVDIGEADVIWAEVNPARERASLASRPENPPHDDPRWPTQCACGYVFQEEDNWQVSQDLIYRCVESGVCYTLRNAPPGAMWYSDWMLSAGSNRWRGPDGHSLTVRVPSSYASGVTDWCIDGDANNCTRPNEPEHKCWCRHGEPPNITVDKTGNTCAAGGGSILVPGYHGMLQGGYLREC